jgi:hypothetical protein
MARCRGSPVAASQITEVSRWLVMPMAAKRDTPPALRITSRQVCRVAVQISAASCSTQPECGKCWASSIWLMATDRSDWSSPTSKAMARLEVVPWSMARISFGNGDSLHSMPGALNWPFRMT